MFDETPEQTATSPILYVCYKYQQHPRRGWQIMTSHTSQASAFAFATYRIEKGDVDMIAIRTKRPLDPNHKSRLLAAIWCYPGAEPHLVKFYDDILTEEIP
jgi:hypothetical protein